MKTDYNVIVEPQPVLNFQQYPKLQKVLELPLRLAVYCVW